MSSDAPAAYLVIQEELELLRGAGLVAISLYALCLKGHTDADGVVVDATYNGLAKALAPRDSRAGGRRLPAPTVDHVRGALDRLESAGLVAVDRKAGKDSGRLRVRLHFPGHVGT